MPTTSSILSLPVKVTDSDGSEITGTTAVITDAADPVILGHRESVRVEGGGSGWGQYPASWHHSDRKRGTAGGKVTIAPARAVCLS